MLPDDSTAPVEARPQYCLACGYSLRGLKEPRCPECGRVFDPADPDTWAPRPDRAPKWFRGVFAGFLIYPFVPIALQLATYGVGAAILGRLPRHGVDNPKTLHPVVSVGSGMVLVSAVVAPFVLAAAGLFVIAMLIGMAGRSRRLFVQALQYGGCMLVSWLIAFLTCRADPFDAGKWLLD